MDNIPIVPFSLILNHLDLKDRLECRNVCTKWMCLIDHHYPFSSLVISRKFSKSRFLEKWCDTNASLNLNNLIFKSDVNLIFSKSFDNLLNKVKSLSLCDLDAFQIVKILNRLNKIERLSIDRLSCYRYDPSYDLMNDFIIKSSTLKLISLGSDILVKKVIIDCPELKTVKTGNYTNLIEFVYPHTVEFCEIENCSFDYAEKFVNLKRLICRYLVTNHVNDDCLLKLSKITEIHLDVPKNDFELFEKLQDQKVKFNLKDLKIFLYGLNLTSSKKYEEFETVLDKKHVKLCIENYSQINDQFFFENLINFDGIISNYTELPQDFFAKFPRLTYICVYDEIQDEDLFIQLIQRVIRTLNKPTHIDLHTNINKHSKEFLTKLSIVCPLTAISSHGFAHLTVPEIDKLIGFSHSLKVVNCKHRVEEEVALQLFTRLKNLFCISFFINCVEYHIFKCNETDYRLNRLDQKIAHFKSINFIFAYLYQSRWDIRDEWLVEV